MPAKISVLHPNKNPLVEQLLHPFQAFVQAETSSGILLLFCTLLALLWANSPFNQSYHQLWELHFVIGLATMHIDAPLHVWINDGLMALFFVLVGLEIKRELLVGELAHVRQAVLPIVAAMGGAIMPALIYLAFNWQTPNATGWGSAIATDIAFALGVLFLVGQRTPPALRVFLTALAIVDDLIAVLAIAIFYSKGISWLALICAGAIVIILLLCNFIGIRRTWVYALLGLVLWLAIFQSGIHATIAGVLLALTIPVRSRIDPQTFLRQSREMLTNFEQGSTPGIGLVMDDRQQTAVQTLETTATEIQAPLQRIERALYIPVSYLIIPLFILANAGVSLQGKSITAALSSGVSLGIVMGLLIGKQLGITLSSWVMIKLGWADLPDGVTWRHLYGVSWLGGIGFTMSLFIADLAFGSTQPATLDQAKVGILFALIVASTVGYIFLRFLTSTQKSQSPTAHNDC